MTDIDTLVTDEMRALEGVWEEPFVSDPVSESDIRRWAIAVYWPETPPRHFWDREYAATTRWGGIVAPEDFNPFAWRVTATRRPPSGALPNAGAPKKGGNILNGGLADTFGARMRPGDVITGKTRLSHWEEREGRNGLTLFTYREIEWTNQHDDLVKRRIMTLIRY